MWKCNQCGRVNPDKNLICEDCGSIVPDNTDTSEKNQNRKTDPALYEKTCKQAKKLEDFSRRAIWHSWFLGFWLYVRQVEEPFLSAKNILDCAFISIVAITIGTAIKCVLESLAIIVEASYRSLDQ